MFAGLRTDHKVSDMETLISNINGVQRRTRGTRSFLVAPASLIVPGVLNGSKGRLFYPGDEVQKVVDPWNGMPVVIYHPTKQGQPISGRHPDVFDVGRVYNTKYNGRLTAEAWIDEELLLAVDQGTAIRDRLLSGDKIEVSTGLYTENEKKSGIDQLTGQAYDYIARNYRPDHLAILPDQRGACSVNDGCGLNVNAAGSDCGIAEGGFQPGNSCGNGGGGSDDSHAKSVEKVNKKLPKDFHVTKSSDGTFSIKHKTSNKTYTSGSDTPDDAFGDFKDNYSHTFKHTNNSESNMDKDELVNWLITNSDVWVEEDRVTLNAMPELKLKTMKDKMSKKKCTCDDESEVPAINSTQVNPMTSAEWLAAAPPEWTSVLNNAKDIELQERQRLANVIVANTADDAARKAAYAVYMGMPLQTLRTLVAAAPTANAVKPDDAGGLLPFGYQPQYPGAGGGPITPTTNAGVVKTDIIPLQEIDWKELSTSTMKS